MKFRRMLQAKIHGVKVTQADLNYEGSIAIPSELLKATNMLPNEAVWVWNVTNGSRFETYIIETDRPGFISVNGAAARLVSVGDKLIVASFCQLEDSLCAHHEPKVVFIDESNKIKEIRAEIFK